MVYQAFLNRLYYIVMRESKVNHSSDRLTIELLSRKVLSDQAIVCIAKFHSVIVLVKEIVNIHIVDIS